MRIVTQALWLPKYGNSVEEYEDAFWPEEDSEKENPKVFRCAVADGATETSFSGLWARLLAQEYGQQARYHSWLRALPRLRAAWQASVNARPLPWYAEQKAQSGAFSSLLGLTLRPADAQTLTWESIAVGDSCLAQMRDDTLLAAFPIQLSEAFGAHPYLISSKPQNDMALKENTLCERGRCRSGDIFYLMTDALACWFLQRYEEGDTPHTILAELTTADTFAAFVEQARRERAPDGRPRMRNDDVTLLRVTVSA